MKFPFPIEPLESRIALAYAPHVSLGVADGEFGFKLVGAAEPDSFGRSDSTAGDVNGDGYADVIIAARYAERSYVVFGKADGFSASLEVSALDGTNGFTCSSSSIVTDVSGAGDVNGDGFDDLIIGTPFTGEGGIRRGATYIVFGHDGVFEAELNLSALDGSNGFKLAGTEDNNRAGYSVSAAGDVNGDGFDDVIIGSPFRRDDYGPAGFGASYVIFGKASGFNSVLLLSDLDGTNGFRLSTDNANSSIGFSVHGAGDVNGDGFDDVIMGAPFADDGAYNGGAAYVVFGKAGPFNARLDLATLDGSNGFKLLGAEYGAHAGAAVSGAGDLNGDGFEDVLIGAPDASEGGGDDPRGASYVVFGRSGDFSPAVALSTLDGSNGFKLSGIADGDHSGSAVSTAGDMNGDGFADLIIGALGTRGESYVIFGSRDGPPAAPEVTIAKNGKRATFTDVDGDLVTVRVTKGKFDPEMFDLRAEGLGAQLVRLALVDPQFAGADLTFSAQPQNVDADPENEGNQMVNVGFITGGEKGVSVAAVMLPGDLGRIYAGLQSLTVASLGALGTTTQREPAFNPLESVIGSLGKLKVSGDVKDASFAVYGDLGHAKIDGSFTSSGEQPGGIRVEGKLGFVSIGGDLSSTDPAKPIVISALGALDPATAEEAVAIGRIVIGGDIANARFLAGYDLSSIPRNPDAGVGAVKIRGYWAASSLVAGLADLPADGFGRNDILIREARVDAIFARIASVTIGGSATGSVATGDFFGITAQAIGRAKVAGVEYALSNRPDDLLIDAANEDFRLIESPIIPAEFATFPLAALNGRNGFSVFGESFRGDAGDSVSAAGDVNGDGFADFIIATRDVSTGRYAPEVGGAYVIFGKASGFPSAMSLSDLDGSNGFALKGGEEDSAGSSVSGAGDVNGDGFDDVIVGAPGAYPNGSYSGAAYVIFGRERPFPAVLRLATVNGATGFAIAGEAVQDRAGNSVSGAGDVNGDGFDDLIIGAAGADSYGSNSGASYVVFGQAAPPFRVQLGSLDGTNGFKLEGAAAGDGAGDVNGDGFDDVILGAPGADPHGDASGASYVIFGKAGAFPATLDLATLDGTNGFKLNGASELDRSGSSVGGKADVNGDGFADLLVGAQSNAFPSENKAYVVFGKSGGFPPEFELSTLDGTTGFVITGGRDPLIRAGSTVSSAGDFNGDGFDDVLIGSGWRIAENSSRFAGVSFLVFGKADGFVPILDVSAINGFNGVLISGQPDRRHGPGPASAVSSAGDFNRDGFDDLLIGFPDARGSRGETFVVFGFAPGVTIASDGRSATVRDSDGDLVTVTTSAGRLGTSDFQLGPNGGIARLDLTGHPNAFAGASLSIAVTTPHLFGDGLADVGAIDARGLDLGSVTISGDLGQIDAGSANLKTSAIQRLSVGSLGARGLSTQDGVVASLHSDIAGDLGKLKVNGDINSGVTLAIGGRLGSGSVAGDLDRATISVLSLLNPVDATNAIAIGSLSIGGSVTGSRILAGYDLAGVAVNADVAIGNVKVGGDWSASDLVAGIVDTNAPGDPSSPPDGFGRNDTVIPGGSAAILARIARVSIKGGVSGSESMMTDHFGFTAEIIEHLRISGVPAALTSGKDDLLLDGANADFRLVEI